MPTTRDTYQLDPELLRYAESIGNDVPSTDAYREDQSVLARLQSALGRKAPMQQIQNQPIDIYGDSYSGGQPDTELAPIPLQGQPNTREPAGYSDIESQINDLPYERDVRPSLNPLDMINIERAGYAGTDAPARLSDSQILSGALTGRDIQKEIRSKEASAADMYSGIDSLSERALSGFENAKTNAERNANLKEVTRLQGLRDRLERASRKEALLVDRADKLQAKEDRIELDRVNKILKFNTLLSKIKGDAPPGIADSILETVKGELSQ